jgi:hypothetical protein
VLPQWRERVPDCWPRRFVDWDEPTRSERSYTAVQFVPAALLSDNFSVAICIGSAVPPEPRLGGLLMSRLCRWSCAVGALVVSIQCPGLESTAVAQRYSYAAPQGGFLKSASHMASNTPQPAYARTARKTAQNSSRNSAEIPAEWRVEQGQPSYTEASPSYVEYGDDYSSSYGTYGDACGGCGGGGGGCGGCGEGCGTGCDSCGGCGDTCGSCCIEDQCGGCGPRYRAFADYLYLQVTDADVAHAQQQNGIGGAGTVPYGDIGTIELEYNSGVRVGGIVACDDCSGVYYSFTHFESDAFSDLEAPDITGGGGAVGSLVHHPQAQITASQGPVNAEYEINYQLADLMFRRQWRGDGCWSVNYLIGAQYGRLEQDFAQTGVFSGGNAGTIDTFTTINFDGGGLKVGIDSERQFGLCFSGYSRLTAAAMSGRFTSRYTMLNSTTETLLAQANWKDDRVIAQVEYEIGLALTSCNRRWRWATGYMFSHWGNVVNTTEFIDAVRLDYYGDIDETVSFDGLVTRLEARW